MPQPRAKQSRSSQQRPSPSTTRRLGAASSTQHSKGGQPESTAATHRQQFPKLSRRNRHPAAPKTVGQRRRSSARGRGGRPSNGTACHTQVRKGGPLYITSSTSTTTTWRGKEASSSSSSRCTRSRNPDRGAGPLTETEAAASSSSTQGTEQGKGTQPRPLLPQQDLGGTRPHPRLPEQALFAGGQLSRWRAGAETTPGAAIVARRGKGEESTRPRLQPDTSCGTP